MSIASQFVRFCVVGAIGFVVDGGVLALFVDFGTNPYLARLISFPLAVATTWRLNRIWTFSASNSLDVNVAQKSRYLAIQIAGALLNYLIYVWILSYTDKTAIGALLSFAVGSAVAMIMNFAGSRYFVFQSHRMHRITANNNQGRPEI
jgi:putative flippase GtrA